MYVHPRWTRSYEEYTGIDQPHQERYCSEDPAVLHGVAMFNQLAKLNPSTAESVPTPILGEVQRELEKEKIRFKSMTRRQSDF